MCWRIDTCRSLGTGSRGWRTQPTTDICWLWGRNTNVGSHAGSLNFSFEVICQANKLLNKNILTSFFDKYLCNAWKFRFKSRIFSFPRVPYQNRASWGEMAFVLYPFSPLLKPQSAPQGFEYVCMCVCMCVHPALSKPAANTSAPKSHFQLGDAHVCCALALRSDQPRGFHRPWKKAQGLRVGTSRVLCD